MVVRDSHLSIILFFVKFFVCVILYFLYMYLFNYILILFNNTTELKQYTLSFAFEVKSFEESLSVMSNVELYNTDWTLSLPIHVNGLLLIHKINEIARETQCFTLPCNSTQSRFDFTNIIIEEEICWGSNHGLSDRKQCFLTTRPNRHCPYRNRIEYKNIFIV